MNCNVIKDLLPLYIDQCCSKDSEKEIEKHLQECAHCKKVFDDMTSFSVKTESVKNFSKKPNRVNDWKASVLQSILLFISFGLITVGVSMEAATGEGLLNGYWAFNLVIPATGFMLSLANWYFIRLYRSKAGFSNISCLLTFGFTLIAAVWAVFHYEIVNVFAFARLGIMFVVLTIIFCILSKCLSALYAKMLGKE